MNRSILKMCISVDLDTFSNDDHEELDEGTLELFKSDWGSNKEPICPRLLGNFALEDERLVS